MLLIFGLLGVVCVDKFLELASNDKNTYETIWHYVFQNPLALAALIGFPILIKRVSETRLQSRSMKYNAANELLWSERLESRVAGIRDLWRMAQTYPKEEYYNAMNVFSQFIKNPPLYELDEKRHNKHQYLKSVHPKRFKQEKTPAGKRTDIGVILWYMSKRSVAGIVPHRIVLRYARLEEAYLEGARLGRSHLYRAHLEGAHLNHARLEGARLIHAHLEGAHLKLTIINEADFTDAKGLKKGQFNKCVFITDHPHYKQPPLLPNGIEHNYKRMSMSEWRGGNKREY